MTTRELIQSLGLKYLSPRDVERLEDAMNSNDAETMLMLVDDLVGKAGRPGPKRLTTKANRAMVR